jgi:Na+-driven multidrug efflux pump
MMMSGMLPIGVAEATCTLVGNNIGAGLPELAKKLYKTSFVICWSIAGVTVLLMLVARE